TSVRQREKQRMSKSKEKDSKKGGKKAKVVNSVKSVSKKGKPVTLTTSAGIPVGDNQNSLTAGPRGPLLIQDWQLFEKHAHFNRERIPERVVHAKGSAAFGTLTKIGRASC